MSTPTIDFASLSAEHRAELDGLYTEILLAADPKADTSTVAALRLRLEVIHLRIALRSCGPVSGPAVEIAALRRRIHELEADLAEAHAELERWRYAMAESAS